MTKGTAINDVRYGAVSLGDYGEKAIQCCINSWNRLYPQYSLKNLKKTATRKRWVFCGSNVVTVKEEGVCDQISKIVFGVNNRLTAKDSSLVTVNCWIWWNCEGKSVRGWLEHIIVDIDKDRVVKFPNITPAISHIHLSSIA
jgi:hypothetical protein